MKTGQGRADIAEMDAEDLAASAEVLDYAEDVFAHLVSAFRPGADAESQSPVFAASGDVIGAFVAVVVGEDLRHAIHHRERWIVRVQGETDVRLFGNG